MPQKQPIRITISQAANLFGVSEKTVLKMRNCIILLSAEYTRSTLTVCLDGHKPKPKLLTSLIKKVSDNI